MASDAKPSVWIAPSAFAPRVGGIEHAALRLGQQLQRRGHPVLVVVHRHPDALPEREQVAGLDVARVSFPSPTADPRGLLRAARSFPRALRSLDGLAPPDVVHVHGASIQLPVLGWFCRHRAVPLVVTTHGEVDADDHGIYATSTYLRVALQRCASRAVALTAVSAAARAGASAVAPAFAAARVIPNGVDADEWDGVAPVPAEPVFGAWGRHEAAKGFDVLLAAFALVRRAVPDARLLLGGSGSQALRAADGVEFLGQLSRDGVASLLARSRVVVVPSRKEAFGMVALEAMAAGRQVVWSDLAGLREATGGLGVPVPPDDPDALAAGMRSALDGPGDAVALREHVRSLSWDAAADAYLRSYEVAR